MELELKRVQRGSKDLEALLRLEREAFGEGAMTIWALDPFTVHGCCHVFFLGDEVVAEALWLADWADPGLAYLFSFAVDRKHRGRGLGTRSLELALADLSAAGKRRVELTVAPDNEAALALYLSTGFRRKELRSDVYGPGADRWILECFLVDSGEGTYHERDEAKPCSRNTKDLKNGG